MADLSLSFRYCSRRSSVVRSVVDAAGKQHLTELTTAGAPDLALGLSAAFDIAWLRLPARPWLGDRACPLRTADVFSGCGGMTVGACEAAWALGLSHESVLAIDTDETALEVFRQNFAPRVSMAESVETVFDGEVGARLTKSERRLRSQVPGVDLLLAGPPCQGNSDLNNHTRRVDPKNGLYARIARCAEVLRPAHVVIENVPGVLLDRGGVVGRTEERLHRMGFSVKSGVLDASLVGVPQTRRRHFLVASRAGEVDLGRMTEPHLCPCRPLSWSLQDLLDVPEHAVLDVPFKLSSENQARIAYLFDNGLYDLPDSQRPDCHRLKPHKYKAMYGRLRWDLPAPTITSGFGSPGQGRYVHPLKRRTLTPHEAARAQFFPDFFTFGDQPRNALRALIANAVPSKLAFILVLELLRGAHRVPAG
jgi:DNA (cytosine-5)-methyltransferase 1